MGRKQRSETGITVYGAAEILSRAGQVTPQASSNFPFFWHGLLKGIIFERG